MNQADFPDYINKFLAFSKWIRDACPDVEIDVRISNVPISQMIPSTDTPPPQKKELEGTILKTTPIHGLTLESQPIA